jgi:hypothetical protein
VAGVFRQETGQEDLYTVRTDGTQVSQVTDTPAFEDFPDWARH